MADGDRPLPLFDERPGEDDEADATRPLPEMPAEGLPRSVEPPPAPPGAGQLVRLAWPALALLTRIAAGATPADPERLKAESLNLLRAFERVAPADGVETRIVSASSYILCTAIDEAVGQADPAAAAVWSRGSLLSILHNETWGGERVFALADRALAEPDRFGDLLELFHLVLVLGFQGRFRRERDGTAKADALRGRIFEALRPRIGSRPVFPAEGTRPPARAPRGRLVRYVPIWSVAVVCLLLSSALFAWLDYRVRNSAESVAAAIREISAPVRPNGR
ncbi:MAG: type IVB secretion system protein IcmH/DotU [Proteobacteria bacterium]|nr:type IVB secretion system protein IcmH/DotU [Pseudomonadota bacterium]